MGNENCIGIFLFFKSGLKDYFTNYRPVSLLLHFLKILEKLFNNRLNTFLEINNTLTLSNSQYGFRNNSTIIAELFNNHFSSFMDKYVADSDLKQYPFIPTKIKQYVDSKVSINTYFEIPQISREFVIKYLNTMPVKKGTGLDDIQALCNTIIRFYGENM